MDDLVSMTCVGRVALRETQAMVFPVRYGSIPVNLPEVKGREEILRIHARDVPLEPGLISRFWRAEPGDSPELGWLT